MQSLSIDVGNLFTTKPLLTLAALLLVLLFNLVLGRGVGQLAVSPQQRRRARMVSRAVAALTLLLCLAVIWAQELRAAALVLSAFAVALVVGSKELITAALGWWIKMASSAYRVGDRITVGTGAATIKGDVLDYNLLTTTLMQVGDGGRGQEVTGNVLTVPNSLLLTQPVQNETRTFTFERCRIPVAVPEDEPWSSAEARLLAAAGLVWSEHEEDVANQLHRSADTYVIDAAELAPRVYLRPVDDGAPSLVLHIALPVYDLLALRDRILRAYFAETEATG